MAIVHESSIILMSLGNLMSARENVINGTVPLKLAKMIDLKCFTHDHVEVVDTPISWVVITTLQYLCL